MRILVVLLLATGLVLAGQRPAKWTYRYVSQSRFDGNLRLGQRKYVGSIDPSGMFRPFVMPPTGGFAASAGAPDPEAEPYNTPRWPDEPVYEFRAGRLIPGILREDGVFVPDLDGRIAAVEDYPYDPATGARTQNVTQPPEGQEPTVRRIYNLPGYFRALQAE